MNTVDSGGEELVLQRLSAEKRLMKPRICIVGQNAYGALTSSWHGHGGGVEVQTAEFARWLSGRGYDSSFVTWREGADRDERHSGVRVVPMCAENAGVVGLRFFYPRMTSFLSALEKADADIYYHNCADYFAGVLATWCALRRRTFIYSTASDADCRRQRPHWQTSHEWCLYKYGLRRADLVIAQTKSQQATLKREHGLNAVVLPMPSTLRSSARQSPRGARSRSGVVAWVGRMDPRKRLDHLFQIARQMPSTKFLVAAPSTRNSEYEKALLLEAQSIPNIDWLGRVPRDRMSSIYQEAHCLCCTSLHEGFPNTFIEAWSHGTPVVSSFDPDDIIEDCNLGLRARTIEEFVNGIDLLINSPAEWETRSTNAIRYYGANHSPEAALPRFEATLLSAWRGNRR